MKDSYFKACNDQEAITFFDKRTARARTAPLRLRKYEGSGYAVDAAILAAKNVALT